ncbi:hypothetical protein LJB89_03005 [Tyzzerella sp. OttesenSCG-928-J15]|nr:hypothetical protein [Tyzzerella sp. OttesenSCG-928-J15]MDL2288013.1 hypothetical protein [Oscillospiraceae bacterium OttesenSCG-928-F05]
MISNYDTILLSTKKCSCPCGEGLIYEPTYIVRYHNGDFQRPYQGLIRVECKNCTGKYLVEEIRESAIHAPRWTEHKHCLSPIDYPDYDGFTVNDCYGEPIDVRTPLADETQFYRLLIEQYSFKGLTNALDEANTITNSSHLQGLSHRIVNSCLYHTRTKAMARLRAELEKAVAEYHNVFGNGDQRNMARYRERLEREEYYNKKIKKCFPFTLEPQVVHITYQPETYPLLECEIQAMYEQTDKASAEI